LWETRKKFLDGSLHPANVLMCPHTCVTNLPKPRQHHSGIHTHCFSDASARIGYVDVLHMLILALCKSFVCLITFLTCFLFPYLFISLLVYFFENRQPNLSLVFFVFILCCSIFCYGCRFACSTSWEECFRMPWFVSLTGH